MDNKIELSQESAVAIENVFDSYVVRKITNDMNDNSADLKKSILGTEYSEEDNLKDLIKRDTGKIISSSNEELINNLIKNLTDDEGSIPEIVEEKLNNRANALTEEISNALNEKIEILKSLIVEYDSRLSRMEKSTDQIRSDLNENSKELQFKLFGSESNENESLNNLIANNTGIIMSTAKEALSEYIDKKADYSIGLLSNQLSTGLDTNNEIIEKSKNESNTQLEQLKNRTKEIQKDIDNLSSLSSDLKLKNDSLSKKITALITVETLSVLGIIALVILTFFS